MQRDQILSSFMNFHTVASFLNFFSLCVHHTYTILIFKASWRLLDIAVKLTE